MAYLKHHGAGEMLDFMTPFNKELQGKIKDVKVHIDEQETRIVYTVVCDDDKKYFVCGDTFRTLTTDLQY